MAKLYIGNLPPDGSQSEHELEDLFGKYGKISNVWVARKPGGFAFVSMEDERDAQDAARNLNGKHGWRVEVSTGGGRRGPPGGGGGGGGGRGGYKVSITGIPEAWTWRELKDCMRRGGEVTFANVDPGGRGTGVAEFVSRDDMDRAIRKLDDTKTDEGSYIRLKDEGFPAAAAAAAAVGVRVAARARPRATVHARPRATVHAHRRDTVMSAAPAPAPVPAPVTAAKRVRDADDGNCEKDTTAESVVVIWRYRRPFFFDLPLPLVFPVVPFARAFAFALRFASISNIFSMPSILVCTQRSEPQRWIAFRVAFGVSFGSTTPSGSCVAKISPEGGFTPGIMCAPVPVATAVPW
eukprot:CAMPEP_0170139990 /NCGR_PEP_ID=MMETSP0033_2-20121228/6043_1 /TAXON_ID=195969 /ORGANISM="Dolichomastix tenuilepis, Strain CCMP3274" /LENGTH=350 /DNA_ID=CAMNT_0010376157 /DNA_START=6 /DNA_END=1057 /DNA_ORIENTATION=-